MSVDRVQGGTNAGWRNPFAGRAMPWQCECTISISPRGDVAGATSIIVRKTNIGALVACPDCGVRRS